MNRDTSMGDVERGLIVAGCSTTNEILFNANIEFQLNVVLLWFIIELFVMKMGSCNFLAISKNVLRCQTSTHQLYGQCKMCSQTETTFVELWLLNVNQYVNTSVHWNLTKHTTNPWITNSKSSSIEAKTNKKTHLPLSKLRSKILLNTTHEIDI